MSVDIARKNLFHDRTRFLITVVGVTFSVVLIFAQVGIYLGFIENASIIIDNTDAEIWITSKSSANFDFPLAFDERRLAKVKEVPGVADADYLILTWLSMRLADGGSEAVELIGFNPHTGVGGPWQLVEGSVQALKAGHGLIVDESAFPKLGALRVGDLVEVDETRLRVVGISRGVRGFTTAPYVFTSLRTAREVDPRFRDRTVFIVARVVPGHDPSQVAERLRALPYLDVHTRDEYSLKTRLYWTLQTGLGVGFALTALMAVVVGTVVVAQTIYTATIEHLREFGTLKAIGATNRMVYGIIVEQAVINAVVGYAAGLLITLLAVHSSSLTGVVMVVRPPVMLAVFIVAVAMCLGAAVISVRKALQVDPVMVFRA
ncbi:MAG: ABC transporter permease [Candidatus Rokubacteria bacterium]|nr:ABC transporter permease [Candidatus Rokubacteria bacterium]MBI3826501.1 ABC transporter permease [Candidatus Rokubacteria bacterium]